MRPFDVASVLEPLTDPYPRADLLLAAVRGGGWDVRCAISRLWLSEGIPFAFGAKPGLYETLRFWFARELRIAAKEVTLIGSGRQGFCLSQGNDVGRPFGPGSDLDFTAVSSDLFDRLRDAFHRWEKDYEQGLVHPQHDRAKRFWNDNRDNCPSGLRRGFIDPKKIPRLDRYPESKAVGQALWLLHEKLKLTPGAPTIRSASLRVYRDWNSFIQQMALNLEAVARTAQVQADQGA